MAGGQSWEEYFQSMGLSSSGITDQEGGAAGAKGIFTAWRSGGQQAMDTVTTHERTETRGCRPERKSHSRHLPGTPAGTAHVSAQTLGTCIFACGACLPVSLGPAPGSQWAGVTVTLHSRIALFPLVSHIQAVEHECDKPLELLW